MKADVFYRSEFPESWVSLKTGNKFPYSEYTNHGFGGKRQQWNDLPADEYPYTIEYNKH